jgi:hypothetical protein
MTDAQQGSTPRKPSELLDEVLKEELKLRQAVHDLVGKKPELALPARQAEWHVRGLIYHFGRMIELFDTFGGEVSARASMEKAPDVLIMHTPEFQLLLFEFYGLVTLGRIALDNLVRFVRRLFASPSGVPKSIRDYPLGSTDCPVLVVAAQMAELEYLCDLRDCLVHYRPFASSDNAVVFGDGVDEHSLGADTDGPWLAPMARAHFRRLENNAVSVNAFIPDEIFVTDATGKHLAEFTYSKKIHMLSFGRDVIRAVAFLTHGAIYAHDHPTDTGFRFDKKKPFLKAGANGAA